MPCSSNTRSIAAKLFAIGDLLPFSKSLTVLRETFARRARSSCDSSSHPRAARLCSGDMDRPKRFRPPVP
jgi:hypothetical protein